MAWSDGKQRDGNLKVLKKYELIVDYTQNILDEEILRLKWDNEEMRKILEKKFKVAGA